MTKKKRKNSSNKIHNLTDSIHTILKVDRNKTFNYKQIAAKLGVNDASSRNQIIKTLHRLKAKQEIEEVDRGKFKAIVSSEYYTGIFDASARGSGYVICEDFDVDIFIASNNVNKALHGSDVELSVYERRKCGRFYGEVNHSIKQKKNRLYWSDATD